MGTGEGINSHLGAVQNNVRKSKDFISLFFDKSQIKKIKSKFSWFYLEHKNFVFDTFQVLYEF